MTTHTLPPEVKVLTWYDPNGAFKDAVGPASTPDEFVEDRRVVVVDALAGYLSCPDCMADERLSDLELLTLDLGNSEYGCIRCKDTGKVWVSI